MIFWTSKGGVGRWKLTEVQKRFLVEIIALVVCSSRVVKVKEHHFVENPAYVLLKIELLLTMLSNFEREVDLKNSAFWWVVCFVYKLLWSVYSLIITIISLALHMFGIFNTCSSLWSNRVGESRETDEEDDENCVEEGFR